MNILNDIKLSMEISREMGSHCPYSGKSDICNASIGLLVPTKNERASYCDNENYDNCPIFLAKVLRKR